MNQGIKTNSPAKPQFRGESCFYIRQWIKLEAFNRQPKSKEGETSKNEPKSESTHYWNGYEGWDQAKQTKHNSDHEGHFFRGGKFHAILLVK